MNRVHGVNKDTRGDRWQARINLGQKGKRKHLGYYKEWWDAVCARKAAENIYGKRTTRGKQVKIVKVEVDLMQRFCLGMI